MAIIIESEESNPSIRKEIVRRGSVCNIREIFVTFYATAMKIIREICL